MFLYSSNFCHFCIQNTMIKHVSSHLCLDTHMPDIPTEYFTEFNWVFFLFSSYQCFGEKIVGEWTGWEKKVRTSSTSINTRSSKALEQLFKNIQGSVFLSVPCRRQDMNRLWESKLSPGSGNVQVKKYTGSILENYEVTFLASSSPSPPSAPLSFSKTSKKPPDF